MPYDDPILKELGGYFKAEEPGRRERAEAWATAIGFTEEDKQKIRELTDPGSRRKKAVRKKRLEKSGKKTVEVVWDLLKAHPNMTLAGLAQALGITRSTIQKHIAHLKAAGRLRRVGPDKGGHWETLE